jgi:hypothetical protein
MEWELADRAEDLGDQIGPYPEGAANLCYRAAGLLRARAAEIAHDKQQVPLTPEQRMAQLREGLPWLFQ